MYSNHHSMAYYGTVMGHLYLLLYGSVVLISVIPQGGICYYQLIGPKSIYPKLLHWSQNNKFLLKHLRME